MNEQIISILKQIDEKIDRMHSPKKWLSVKELAKYLGLSTRKIRALIKENRIPVNKIDGSYRFNINKIDLWLQFDGNKTQFSKRDKSKLEVLR